jgi:formylglycine-generating enzyme required for sulfatase activity
MIANSEVTQGQFKALVGTNPSWFSSTDQGGYADCQDCPVESVSWYEAAAYCNELSVRSGLPSCYECRGSGAEFSCGERKEYQAGAIYDCRGYRLPTEAEWEYAYRAGTQTAFYNGPITSCSEYDLNADQIGWHSPENEKALERPQPVMQKIPNGWGLYDMAGNVAELCQDWYHYIDEVRPPPAVEIDPVWYQYISSEPGRVVRGGDFSSKPIKLRGSDRAWRLKPNRYTGFRCVRQ